MLTLKDCIDLSDLSDAEVAAIAEHEHVPEIIAAEIGSGLVHSPAGRIVLKRYIRENLVLAKAPNTSRTANTRASRCALALLFARASVACTARSPQCDAVPFTRERARGLCVFLFTGNGGGRCAALLL